jgi:hypothetical protein
MDTEGGMIKLAVEYVRQIRATDDERALILMREFHQRSFENGWNAALMGAIETMTERITK